MRKAKKQQNSMPKIGFREKREEKEREMMRRIGQTREEDAVRWKKGMMSSCT